MARLWTAKEDRFLRAAFLEGASLAEIADELNRTPRGIQYRCRCLGLRFPWGQPPDDGKRLAILDMVGKGMSLVQASKALGLIHSTVWRITKRLLRDGLLTKAGAGPATRYFPTK